MARTLSAFLGALCWLNLIASAVWGAFNANLWWIDLRPLPPLLAAMLQIVSAAALTSVAVDRPRRRAVRRVVISILSLLLLIAILNAATFYVVLARGQVHTRYPIPFSLLVAGAIGLILFGYTRSARHLRALPALLTAAVCVVGFPLGQMLLFGKTDYRRPADAIVVLGARAYADGRPSDALADRVRTACELYHEGLAKTLIFSGGPGDGPFTEPQAMQRMAISLHVPPDAILLDSQGLNTAATVTQTTPMLQKLAAKRVLVVSHFYHLPRVKLSYQQAGWEVYTVPARERYLLTKMPWLMAREVAALWVYYLRGLNDG